MVKNYVEGREADPYKVWKEASKLGHDDQKENFSLYAPSALVVHSSKPSLAKPESK